MATENTEITEPARCPRCSRWLILSELLGDSHPAAVALPVERVGPPPDHEEPEPAALTRRRALGGARDRVASRARQLRHERLVIEPGPVVLDARREQRPHEHEVEPDLLRRLVAVAVVR